MARRAEADAINYGSFDPYGLCFIFGSKVRVAGVGLPETGDWQVVEKELMTEEDYDRILEEGWPGWWARFLEDRVLDDVPVDRPPPAIRRLWMFGRPGLTWTYRSLREAMFPPRLSCFAEADRCRHSALTCSKIAIR